MTVLDARQVRRRYLVLVALRWLPTGLLIPVTTLLALDRGLTVAEIGIALSAQGLVVAVLELPTGGLADALGRRPVLVLAGVVGTASLALLVVADSLAGFAAAWACQACSGHWTAARWRAGTSMPPGPPSPACAWTAR